MKAVKRVIGIIPAMAVQILWYMTLFRWLTPWSTAISQILSVLAVIFILYLITSNDDGAYKILWIVIILGMPVFGTVLYLMYGNKRTSRLLKRRLDKGKANRRDLLVESASDEIQEERIRSTVKYVESLTGFPMYHNQKADYLPLGDDMFPLMLESMRQAKEFIFIEYFILAPGKMWDSMVEILEEKVKEGVDVRVLYDDIGSFGTYSIPEARRLRKKGILCHAFNPLYMIVGTLNNRDHRKMLIVDGKVAFTGGINLADEYINHIERFGHWKDIGFRIEGEAVKNYTIMFVEFWNAFTKEQLSVEKVDTLLENSRSEGSSQDGYILSYYDSPIRESDASNELYIELLSQAEHSAYFYTPYLMLGEELLAAFERAAKRGVDVRIIMPGIPDKKLIFQMSRSFYYPLIMSGVKIYEYDPGFVHAKGCVIDSKIATVGTVNLDYRSLFLHFENNALFYESKLIGEMEADFLETQEKCHQVEIGKDLKVTLGRWFAGGVLRILSPLC